MYSNSGFWNALTKLKLEVLGLEDTAIDVHGQYVNRDHNEQIKVITVRLKLKNYPEKKNYETHNYCSIILK